MHMLTIQIRLRYLFKYLGCNNCGAKHRYHLYGYIDCYRCGHTFSPREEGRFYISSFTDLGLSVYRRYPELFVSTRKNRSRINILPISLSLGYGDPLIRELNKQLFPTIWVEMEKNDE